MWCCKANGCYAKAAKLDMGKSHLILGRVSALPVPTCTLTATGLLAWLVKAIFDPPDATLCLTHLCDYILFHLFENVIGLPIFAWNSPLRHPPITTKGRLILLTSWHFKPAKALVQRLLQVITVSRSKIPTRVCPNIAQWRERKW